MWKLVYVGDGEHYVIGRSAIPGQTEEVDDLDEALRLAETGLYEIVEGEVPDTDAPADMVAGTEG